MEEAVLWWQGLSRGWICYSFVSNDDDIYFSSFLFLGLFLKTSTTIMIMMMMMKLMMKLMIEIVLMMIYNRYSLHFLHF